MKKSKNIKKLILKIVLILTICFSAVFLLSLLINGIITRNQKEKYGEAYGEFVETENGRINYTIIGEGEDVIVMLPGYGSVSPHYEFLELANELSDTYKMIIVEPLGYGLSDVTSVERNSENICKEIHEVLSNIGEDSYYLMGHSIAGLYSLQYSNMYENEVRGFIGLDATVPAQIETNDPNQYHIPYNAIKLLYVDTGLMRMQINMTPDETYSDPAFKGSMYEVLYKHSAQDRVIIKELLSSVNMNKTAINEIKRLKANCEDEMQLKFPETIPVFYILSKESVDTDPYWEGYHQDMVKNNEKGRVEIVEGNHYVHLTNEEKVVELTREWLQDNE
ncbi:MAG: alpha/beta hydrolase [Eubacterium sp.]|nr:alpha/beta hydrolase [Eubacterium sp.]